MNVSTPHYLLFSEASRTSGSGRWRFVVRRANGSKQFEVADFEPSARGERLDLLTVVRGLEALDQPSRVTLVGCSPYVWQGMQYGLSEWRDNGWRWEFFGQMVPVKNSDLWQRLDRALRFHRVDCGRQWRFDSSHRGVSSPETATDKPGNEPTADLSCRVGQHRTLRCRVSATPAGLWRRSAALARFWRRRLVQSCYTMISCSWGG